MRMRLIIGLAQSLSTPSLTIVSSVEWPSGAGHSIVEKSGVSTGVTLTLGQSGVMAAITLHQGSS